MALNLALGHSHARLGSAHWAMWWTLAENLLHAQAGHGLGEGGGHSPSIQQMQMSKIWTLEENLFLIWSHSQLQGSWMWSVGHKRGAQIEFRKYEQPRAAAGEVGKNTLTCLGRPVPKEFYHLHWMKISSRARTPLFSNQPSFRQYPTGLVNRSRGIPTCHLEKIFTGSAPHFCHLTSIGPLSRKVTAVSPTSLLRLHLITKYGASERSDSSLRWLFHIIGTFRTY